MSTLEATFTISGALGKQRVHALFDSGSTYSIIRRDIAEQVAHLEPLPPDEIWEFETARPNDIIRAKYRVVLSFQFDESATRLSDDFVVFDECSEELIIGAKTMQASHIVLDFDKEKIHYPKAALRLRV